MAGEVKAKEVLEAWWKDAEMERSARNDYLRKAAWHKNTTGGAWQKGVKVCVEKVRWFTKAFKENEGQPWVIKRARGLEALLENIPIFIVDQSRIVGYPGAKPNLVMLHPDAAYSVSDDIFYDQEGYIEQEDREWVREDLDYWRDKCYQAHCERYLSPEERKVHAMGVAIGASAHQGGIMSAVPRYGNVFNNGLLKIMEMIKKNLKETEDYIHQGPGDPSKAELLTKIDQWRAMLIGAQAVINWANRYSRLAKIIAENFEQDPQRKAELLQISEICAKIPAYPCEHFWEAVQCEHLLACVFRHMERYMAGWAFKADEEWWPFYEKDVIKDKIITRKDARELVEEWRIRIYEVAPCKVRIEREATQGIPGPYIITIGGVKADGTDACNELTEVICEAARVIRVSEPSISFRYHPNASIKALREVFECIRHGLGFPSIKNDKVNIAQLMGNFGATLEEARQWVHVVCMSPGTWTDRGMGSRTAHSYIIPGKIMELVFYDGKDVSTTGLQMGPHTGDASKFETWEEFREAVRKQFEYFINMGCRCRVLTRKVETQYYQQPFLSCMYMRCIQSGIDVTDPASGELPNPWLSIFTMGDGAESMYPVKKLVFEEKKYTMAQLVEALRNGWVGYEEMRRDFANLPKWGNDIDEVDKVYREFYDMILEIFKKNKELSGGAFLPLPNTNTAQAWAPRIGALPYGRRQGEWTTDGGCSPIFGGDKKGPTAVLRSAGKLPHENYKGVLLNQRLSPTQLAGEKGFNLWLNYIKTWSDLGIDHVQFNMVDNETLRAAQREPEKYTELIVRVAGWSSHFVDLNRFVQDSIIARNVQEI